MQCLVMAGHVSAHDLWINMSSHFAEPGTTVKAYLGWGHHYPFSDFLSPSRLGSMKVLMPDGRFKKLEPGKCEPGTIIDTMERGTYVVGAAMKPGYYTRTVSGHTFKSKKESEDVISSIWSEKYAKAILCVDGQDNKSYLKPFGHALELVPVSDPCSVRPGEPFVLKVLFREKPLAGVSLSASCLGRPAEKAIAGSVKTNDKGEAGIELNSPGVYRIMLTYKESPADTELCDYNKYSAFLTLEVR